MRINRLRGTVADRPVDVPVAEQSDGNPGASASLPDHPTMLSRLLYSLGGNGQDVQLRDLPAYDKGQLT